MGFKINLFSLTLRLAIVWSGVSAAMADTQGNNGPPAATEAAAVVASQPLGPVVDPAVALPRVMDNTRFAAAKAGRLPCFFVGIRRWIRGRMRRSR